METKHTQGEWRLTEYETPNEYNQPDLDSYQISCGKKDICVLWPIRNIDKKYIYETFTYCLEETEANAKLIAAAPDLLSICKSFNTMLANGWADIKAKEGHESEIAQLFRDNIEAIKKATE